MCIVCVRLSLVVFSTMPRSAKSHSTKSHSAKSHSAKSHSAKSHSVKSISAKSGVSFPVSPLHPPDGLGRFYKQN